MINDFDIGKRTERAGFRSTDFRTVFQMTKNESTGQREFPVFLMVARK